jgi:hypothetical protein
VARRKAQLSSKRGPRTLQTSGSEQLTKRLVATKPISTLAKYCRVSKVVSEEVVLRLEGRLLQDHPVRAVHPPYVTQFTLVNTGGSRRQISASDRAH